MVVEDSAVVDGGAHAAALARGVVGQAENAKELNRYIITNYHRSARYRLPGGGGKSPFQGGDTAWSSGGGQNFGPWGMIGHFWREKIAIFVLKVASFSVFCHFY